ncbi:MAG: hypothetical protein ACRCSV_04235, partial [Chlamydiales bacterium]
QSPHLYAEPTDSEDKMLNGSYYVLDANNTKVGVYKPRLQAQGALDHLPGKITSQREGIPAGSEIFRENLSYFLCKKFNKMISKSRLPIRNFGIPKTKIKALESTIFGEHHQTGSLQKFKKNYRKLTSIQEIKEIPQNEIIKTAIIDIIYLNTDRHLGNLLYSDTKKSLILIDHGSCFPEFKSLNRLRFIWTLSPYIQKSFPQKWIDFILNIDTKKLIRKIILEIEKHEADFPNQQMEISSEALFILICSIESLKKFAKERKLCPIEVHTNYLLGGRFARNIQCIFQNFCDTKTPRTREFVYESFDLIKQMITEILVL